MPVLVNNKKLIPAPFVEVRKTNTATAGGERLGSTLSITLSGTLVVDRGSPNSSGTFWGASGYPADETIADTARLQSTLRKQRAILDLFATDGLTLEIQPFNGMGVTKYNPSVKGITFAEGVWYDRCDYTIELEAEDPSDPGDGILDASEEWNIEPSDEIGRTFRITHSCSATGKKRFDENGAVVSRGWELARTYVLNQIGLGLNPARMQAAGVLDATGLEAFNYVRTQQLNELGGSFAVTETWLGFDPGSGSAKAIEEFTVTTRTDESQRNTVSIEGQIQGLEVRDNSTYALLSERYDNAVLKWTQVSSSFFSRAENLSGVTLNPQALSSSVGRNENSGIISYNYEYNDRAEPTTVGAISEVITVTDNHPADIFAAVPVLGRALGPVLQSLASVTVRKRTLNIEIIKGAQSMSSTPTQPSTAALVLAYVPAGTQVFVDENQESWSAQTGRYTRTVSWTWQ